MVVGLCISRVMSLFVVVVGSWFGCLLLLFVVVFVAAAEFGGGVVVIVVVVVIGVVEVVVIEVVVVVVVVVVVQTIDNSCSFAVDMTHKSSYLRIYKNGEFVAVCFSLVFVVSTAL